MVSKSCRWAAAAVVAVSLPAVHAQLNNAARIALMQDDAGIVLGEPCIVIEKIESIRPLADGTMLTRRTEERKWRDAQGRFRKESKEESQQSEFHTASIIDPTNSTLTLLNLDLKTAIVFHLPDRGPESLHSYADLDDKQPLALPGVQVKVEKLDGKMINGVYAVGRRVTRVRPPGTIGNDTPVVSVAERWVSPDLKILMASSSDDPREKLTREVAKLDRSEPNPALFTIPADFAVKEVTVGPRQQQ